MYNEYNNYPKKNKTLFKIPLINIWYVIITLIFILMRVTNIIDWSPLWILAPLWIPWILVLSVIVIPYSLLGIVWIIDWIIKIFKHRK